MKTTKSKLNDYLINRYNCFNTERFYLDEYTDNMVSIVASTIIDTCPVKLCKGIAKTIKRFLNDSNILFIYVGCYAFPTKDL